MIHPQSLSVGYAQVGFPISPEYPHSHDNYCPCCGAPRNRSLPSQLPQYAPPPTWGGSTITTSSPPGNAIQWAPVHPLAEAAQHAHATASDSVFSIFH